MGREKERVVPWAGSQGQSLSGLLREHSLDLGCFLQPSFVLEEKDHLFTQNENSDR